MPKVSAPVALSLLSVTFLTGCASTLVVEQAPTATDAGCADVMLRLPEEIGDYGQRKTSSQATEGWGEPAAAILRCGMEPPAPTTDPCVTVDGVDWITPVEDRADAPPPVPGEDEDTTWTFISYGRSPAVEIIIDTTKLSGATVLSAVSPAVSTLEQTGKCVAASDLTDEGTVATEAPTDAPTEAAEDSN